MANINVTLCPAVGVLGYGENYRIHNFYLTFIYLLFSVILYYALTKFATYLYLMISKSNAKNASTTMNSRCQTRNMKMKKEE